MGAKLPLAGTPFFYQFKLVEYLSRSNATYIKNGTYNGPYYRIALHDRDNNRQHRLLWQLGQGNPETFYAAPELNKRSSFNDQFLNQQIVPSSRLIRLSDCEQLADTDGESHVITFQQNQPAWIFHSEPRRREQSYSGREILESYNATRARWKPIDDAFSRTLLDQVIEDVRSVEDFESQQLIVAQRHLIDDGVAGLPRPAVLKRVSDIAATVFGATIVLVGSRR
jgi:ribosomal protein S16